MQPETKVISNSAQAETNTPENSEVNFELETEADKEEQTAAIEDPLSEAAQKAEASRKERLASKLDKEEILRWLSNADLEKIDPDLFELFKKALTERSPDDTKIDQSLDQAKTLLRELPRLLSEFDKKIESLGRNETSYKNISKKRNEILSGLCASVINGHLNAEDLLNLVRNIEIISKTNPPEHEKDSIEKMVAESGYDVAIYFDPHGKKITIFEETLSDKFQNLDFKHMINHEISHSIVESKIIRNESLTKQAESIIENANEIKDALSQHTRNMLTSLNNLDQDFEKFYLACIQKNPEYSKLEDNAKEEYKSNQKSQFERSRKIIAVHEILAEFTALYLESDGSFDDFIAQNIQKNQSHDPEKAFGITRKALREMNQANTETRGKMIDKARQEFPAFSKIIDIYLTFYREIRNDIQQARGKYAEVLVPGDNDENEEYVSEELGSFGEPASSFDSTGGQNENKPQNIGGFWKEFGAFFEAFTDEVGAKSIPT